MKITMIEEIEAHKAWTYKMCCPRCNEFKYRIHHKVQPQPDEWWIECDNCNYETDPTPTRDLAIMHWKNNE